MLIISLQKVGLWFFLSSVGSILRLSWGKMRGSWWSSSDCLIVSLGQKIEYSSFFINHTIHLAIDNCILIFAEVNDFLDSILDLVLFSELNLKRAAFLWKLRLPLWLWRSLDLSICCNKGVWRSIDFDIGSIKPLSFSFSLFSDWIIGVILERIGLMSIGHLTI
jgi:hypothetical protein